MTDNPRIRQLLDELHRLARHAGRGVLFLPRAAARSAGSLAGGVPRPGRVGRAVPRADAHRAWARRGCFRRAHPYHRYLATT